MKKKLVFLFVSLFLMAISAESVKAEDQATANAAATIVTPISITKTVVVLISAVA